MNDSQPAKFNLADIGTTIDALFSKRVPWVLLCAPEGPEKPGVSLSNCSAESMKQMIADAHNKTGQEIGYITVQTGHG